MNEFFLPKTDREAAMKKIGAALRSLPDGKQYRIEVKEHRRTRSIQQCRYLNGVAYKILSEATGYERDDVSEFMTGSYFGWREKKVPRKPGSFGFEKVPVRTTTVNEDGERDVLSWADFADYVAYVQRFAASKGIHIPDPDPEMRAAA